jgi:hypothetical protein
MKHRVGCDSTHTTLLAPLIFMLCSKSTTAPQSSCSRMHKFTGLYQKLLAVTGVGLKRHAADKVESGDF